MTVTPPRGLGGDPQISTVHFQLVSFSRCARSSSPSLALPSRALLSPVRVLAFARARVWCERALCGTSVCTFSRALLPHSHGAALETKRIRTRPFFYFPPRSCAGRWSGRRRCARSCGGSAVCGKRGAVCGGRARGASARFEAGGNPFFCAERDPFFPLCERDLPANLRTFGGTRGGQCVHVTRKLRGTSFLCSPRFFPRKRARARCGSCARPSDSD